MSAKTIKALDAVIAGLEELKDALELDASKSGSAAGDEDTGTVSVGRPKKPKNDAVPAKGKKSRPVPDDDDDVAGDADEDEADDDDAEEEDDLPEPKAAVKGAAAKKVAPVKTAAAGKAGSKEMSFEDFKSKLQASIKVIETEGVRKVLKKFGAARASEVEQADYAKVLKSCDAAVKAAADDEADDEL